MKLCTVVPISQVVMVLSLQPKDMRSSLRVVYLSAFITCISYCYFCGLLIENVFQKPFFHPSVPSGLLFYRTYDM